MRKVLDTVQPQFQAAGASGASDGESQAESAEKHQASFEMMEGILEAVESEGQLWRAGRVRFPRVGLSGRVPKLGQDFLVTSRIPGQTRQSQTC